MTFTKTFLDETITLIGKLDETAVEALANGLSKVKGRLFILGVGGSAGHASHAVNDFRKICGIEAYTPTDNVSELTARINDDGWLSAFANWLRGSRMSANDAVLVFSVGAQIIGIVGRDGGYTRRVADACVVVPVVNAAQVTAHTEAFQAVVWHGIVSHPKLRANEMKWESTP